MSSYITSMVAQKYVANNTLAVSLAKPAGFTFQAGQYADVVLLLAPFHDLWGNLRTLSMVSAPFEYNLEFVMRISTTAFKRNLSTAPEGTALDLKGPAGNFHLHTEDRRPAVFIAGGVGIAPFVSILRQAEHDRAMHEFYLFHSNPRVSDAPYLEELRNRATDGLLRFHFIPTITGDGDADWYGERGRIDSNMLRRYVPLEAHPVYYIAGPSRFVSAMNSVFTALDVGEVDVQTENFGEF